MSLPKLPTPEALGKYDDMLEAISRKAGAGEDVTADNKALHEFMAKNGIGDNSTPVGPDGEPL